MQETQETQVWSLGQKDPLEKKIATAPVFLPGKSHGQRSLVGYTPCSHKESDTTECVHACTCRHTHNTHCPLWFFYICRSWQPLFQWWTNDSNFLKKFIYFNWRLIILQYCGGVCHTFTWISHGCTCVPHPEPPSHLPPLCPSSGSSQCTSPEHPVSCIEPGLVICFTW